MHHSAIEIRYGQDNDDVIVKAMLRGIAWKNLTADKIVEYFQLAVPYTLITDYRPLTSSFKILGCAPTGHPLLFTISFKRSSVSYSHIPSGGIAFQAIVDKVEDVSIHDISAIVAQAEHSKKPGDWRASVCVITNFMAELLLVRETADAYHYYRNFFRFGQLDYVGAHKTEPKVDGIHF